MKNARLGYGLFGAALFVLIFLGLTTGAYDIGFIDVLKVLSGDDYADRSTHHYVFHHLRVPRTLGAVMVGALLAAAGTAMQGLFRNPLADPGLIGVSTGAALLAVTALFFGLSEVSATIGIPVEYVLPFLAFVGAMLAALLALRLSLVHGRTVLSVLLLIGICIQFFGGAVTSIFVYASDDESLRSITFWTMGGFAGIRRDMLFLLLFAGLPVLFLLWRNHREMDIMTLGETEAEATGVNLKKTRNRIIVLSALAVGVSVATSGVVGFIGLAAPHMARLAFGQRHSRLLPAAILIGAILAAASDLAARTLLAPQEIPVGIITAVIGTPIIVSLLLRMRGKLATQA